MPKQIDLDPGEYHERGKRSRDPHPRHFRNILPIPIGFLILFALVGEYGTWTDFVGTAVSAFICGIFFTLWTKDIY